MRAAMIILLATLTSAGQVMSGGAYTIESSAVASGGGVSVGGAGRFSLTSTIGQAAAGTLSGGVRRIDGGFLTRDLFAPTAAAASLSGRVNGPHGSQLGGALVTLSGGSLAVPLSVRTNTFGRFRFDGVEAGQTYVMTVVHGRYRFEQDSLLINVTEDLSGIVFQAVVP